MSASDETAAVRIGTAGWSIPREVDERFPGEDSHLERFARVLGCAEINSSFSRRHQPQTYAKWAAQTPAGFRFSVKLPRAITHDARLHGVREPLRQFMAEAGGLGDKLAVLLVQLPPSLPYDGRVARTFFRQLADLHGGAVVLEPRHASWFEPAAERFLVSARVGRVAADPARQPAAAVPGGWLGTEGDGVGAVAYYRWHGSPRIYWSSYEPDWLAEQAESLASWPPGTDRWCIFDNTASGAAMGDALVLQSMLDDETH